MSVSWACESAFPIRSYGCRISRTRRIEIAVSEEI